VTLEGTAVPVQPPIHREVLVDADPVTAFEVFTTDISRWWPVADLSVFGARSTVTFDDTAIVETSEAGQRSVWGSVTRWDPPLAVAFSWHPGRDPERASQVEVSFTPAGRQTLVALSHAGWEVYDDPATARTEYGSGWPTVLARFASAVTAAAGEGTDGQTPAGQSPGGQSPDGRTPEGQAPGEATPGEGPAGDEAPAETWVALLHRPGPAAPTDGSLFEDPRLAEHLDFLARMHAAGYLVAAGPLDDEFGAGLTVLRLPGAGRLEEAIRLATREDASVVGEFLTVTVRPWQVMLRA
jgi:uncharacterized protein YciI